MRSERHRTSCARHTFVPSAPLLHLVLVPSAAPLSGTSSPHPEWPHSVNIGVSCAEQFTR